MPDDAWLAAETARLIDFARASRVEGGFASLDDDGAPDVGRPLELYVTARMTHVFALGHLLGRPGCRELVDHGVEALVRTFEDREHGGWFDAVRGRLPEGTDKGCYGHVFVVLAASSAVAAGRPAAVALLDRALAVVQERFWSEPEGACLEAWDRAWTAPEDYRGANANMHAVEAFLAAGDVTGERVWHERAHAIADKLIGGYARDAGWRVPEHYTSDWKLVPDYNAGHPNHPFRPYGVTPGHGLEWARLVLQLRATLPGTHNWMLEAAQGLFERAVGEGWDDAAGGFAYTVDWDGSPVVADRFHWVVAEAIGATAALRTATGDDAWSGWEERFWAFAREHFVDDARGGWIHELDEHNVPGSRTWEGKPDTYHALQATLIPRVPLAPALAPALARGALA